MDGIGVHRPRNLDWKRAAALLYGDWGTSKAYVIGLALFSIGFAALPHLLAVCALTNDGNDLTNSSQTRSKSRSGEKLSLEKQL